MPRLPRLRGREVIAALRRTVVPVHAGETIGPGLLNKILKDVEMDVETFETWL